MNREPYNPASIWQARDIRGHVLAGICLCLRGVQVQGGDKQYVAGVLSMAEHQAHAAQLDWPEVLEDAKLALGGAMVDLIDQALMLGPGK